MRVLSRRSRGTRAGRVTKCTERQARGCYEAAHRLEVAEMERNSSYDETWREKARTGRLSDWVPILILIGVILSLF